MRIPHFLTRAPSGVWHFRQRVPADIAPKMGCAAIKRSLGTGFYPEITDGCERVENFRSC